MATSGGQPGNQNARKARLFQEALKRALARASGENINAGLDTGADKLVAAYHAGEAWAIKEVADRLDGKPAQQLIHNGDEEGGAVRVDGVIKLTRPKEGGE